jgi:hypothetical protein
MPEQPDRTNRRRRIPRSDDTYWRCWSCGIPIGSRNGIDLRGNPEGEGGGPGSPDGTVDLQVCTGCWAQVPIWARLAIGLAFRGRVAGGVGIHELAEQARAAIEEFRRRIQEEGESDE